MVCSVNFVNCSDKLQRPTIGHTSTARQQNLTLKSVAVNLLKDWVWDLNQLDDKVNLFDVGESVEATGYIQMILLMISYDWSQLFFLLRTVKAGQVRAEWKHSDVLTDELQVTGFCFTWAVTSDSPFWLHLCVPVSSLYLIFLFFLFCSCFLQHCWG